MACGAEVEAGRPSLAVGAVDEGKGWDMEARENGWDCDVV